jgi:hypothetical protein
MQMQTQTNDDTPEVPARLRGVWVRTLLQTPTLTDTSTSVHWMQTARWHADLRVPDDARNAAGDAGLVRQQGFCGVTTVKRVGDDEVCAWHRRVDFQPPGPHPDAGRIVFETPDTLIETGIHADYLEIWQRLTGSTGRSVVLEALPSGDGAPATRLLVSGGYAMRVRARAGAWPADTTRDDTLATLLQRHPQRRDLLDFEISYGTLARGRLCIIQSSLPAMEGRDEATRIRRISVDTAVNDDTRDGTRWRIVEWTLDGKLLD